MGKKRPTHEIKLGRIKTAIWENQSENQSLWFSVTVARVYKVDGEWKETTSFDRDDLPIVNKAIDMAYGWILRHERKLELAKRDHASHGG